MLDLAVKENVHPVIEVRPMKDIQNALQDMEKGKPRRVFDALTWLTRPRFRYVLDAKDSGL